MEIQKEQFLMASDYDLYFKSISQADKIAKIEKLFKKGHQLPIEELKTLIHIAIDKKDIHILGYCLAHEMINNLNKEDLFLYACEKDFKLGVQLIASEIDLKKEKHSVEHGNKNLSLLNHGLLKVIGNDNPKPGIRFFLNQGANLRFDDDYLFIYAYEKNYMKAVEYLIKEKNIPINIRNNHIEKNNNINNDIKLKTVQKIFNQYQYEQTQNIFVMKELPANVTRRKL